ncbi:MAG: DUF2243 domain-containing protein [Archangiaceae bacterium]|nr:DUF2243 domain-containing protein [Archangiaceae bacterium]
MFAVIALVGRKRALLAAAMVVGLGMGGFVDGIVLHQLLQWHNMMSSKVPPDELIAMKYNMIFDGIFHLATWLAVALGLGLLFRCGKRGVAFDGREFAAGLMWGWGLFNSIEGVFDHQLYGLHHVHPGAGQLAWDVAFILSGLLLGVLGALAMKNAGRGAPERRLHHA